MSNKLDTKAVKPESKRVLNPKMRFPEFKDEPEWNAEKLGAIASLITERVGNRKCIPMSITSGVGLVSQHEKFGRTIAGNQYENYLVLQKDDFAYNKSATKEFPQGFIAKYSGDEPAAVPNSIFTCFRAHKDGIVPDFLNYLFAGNLHGKWLKKYIEVSARAHGSLSIDDKILLSLPIPLPSGGSSRAEQQKIVACLTSLEELISAHSQKLAALKSYKNALMRQLSPCDGETIPRLRFPEFQNAAEWEELPLSRFVKSLDAGVSVNSGDRPASKGEAGVLKTSAVTNGVFNPQENKVVLDEIELLRLREPVSEDTIIISRMNTPALVGANAYVDANFENIFLPDRLWAAKPKPGTSMRFLAFTLGSEKGRAALTELATGTSGSMKNITKPDVLALQIIAPSLPEQEKIVACLLPIDELIAAQTQRLEAIKAHRKGLMQQLLPSSEGAL